MTKTYDPMFRGIINGCKQWLLSNPNMLKKTLAIHKDRIYNPKESILHKGRLFRAMGAEVWLNSAGFRWDNRTFSEAMAEAITELWKEQN